MKILVTGATGFVGFHRINHLRENGYDTIGVGRSRNLPPELYANYHYVKDIAEPDSIKYIVSRHTPDYIEHYASVSTVDVSRSNPYETYRVNVLGVVSVLETAKEFGLPCMIFTTDKVYGYASQIADEGTFLMPDAGAYENSKTTQDMIAQSYNLNSHNITVVRSSNIYGPNDRNRRIIPNTIRDLSLGKSPVIFSNIHTIRQFIYIKDLMTALDTIGHKEGIYNVGTDIYLKQEDVVLKILKLWNEKHGTSIEADFVEGKDMHELAAQLLVWEKLKALGWKPKYTFEQGIGEMI